MPLLKASLPRLKMIIEFTPYSLKQAGASGMALLELVNELELPMQLIDHLGRQLRPISRIEMQQWIAQTDAAVGNEGFINLLVGHPRITVTSSRQAIWLGILFTFDIG